MQKASEYYGAGYNCSECLLKAFEETYRFPMSRQCYSLCGGISSGFGCDGTCSVLVAAVMILGLIFDKETVKKLRMKLFYEFTALHKDVNCFALKKDVAARGDCRVIINEIARITQKIINESLQI
jgi:C_GCAxxG_C_C family probable redox protein